MSEVRDLTTEAGLPVREVYHEHDLAPDLADRLGAPGAPPFTRGPYPSMYRGQLWTMRQFAGFGSPEEANERFHFLRERGQTALSVAFDLPTQLGYDSSHAIARPEVGRVGVAIDTAEDMVDLFSGLPLDQVSVNFTINATAPIILAMYLVAAERQGVTEADLTGTLQNDILKEFLARKAFVFPPEPSLRLSCDVVEFASGRLPRFNPISITGYHAREAGCDAVQELALTLASAVAYSEALVARGLSFDAFAPRLSFHFATTMDLFEEVAKLRAARRMWYRIATERFGARSPNSGRLRFFSGNSGTTLTAQQPLNNIIRSTIQCLGAVLGGAQSIHVMGYDEAFEIPSEEAVTLSLRTQQIVALESGVPEPSTPSAARITSRPSPMRSSDARAPSSPRSTRSAGRSPRWMPACPSGGSPSLRSGSRARSWRARVRAWVSTCMPTRRTRRWSPQSSSRPTRRSPSARSLGPRHGWPTGTSRPAPPRRPRSGSLRARARTSCRR